MVDLDVLINSINIVDFISQYVELEEKNGEWWGLSPFKQERTPSFSVRESTNKFFDFSSGLGGSVFTFVKNYYKCSNTEAIKILEDYCSGKGMNLRERLSAASVCKKFLTHKTGKTKNLNNNITKGELLVINHSSLPSRDEFVAKYELDYDKLAIWEKEEISRDIMEEYLVRYDAYSNRIVYPIINLSGEIENVGGRTLDPLFQEKGLRKYCYFYKWQNGLDVIYGLWHNKQACIEQKEIILFEGAKSVLKASSWGLANTGAILTSHLSAQQMRILAELGVRVVFALDEDIDIRKDKHIQFLKNFVNVEYIWNKGKLLGKKDAPVDKGAEVFLELYENRKRL